MCREPPSPSSPTRSRRVADERQHKQQQQVWNEPNDQFWQGTQEEYFLLYREAANGLKNASQRLRVRGRQLAWSRFVWTSRRPASWRKGAVGKTSVIVKLAVAGRVFTRPPSASHVRCDGAVDGIIAILSSVRSCSPALLMVVLLFDYLSAAAGLSVFQVGGPATCCPDCWLQDFVQMCANTSTPFDFISSHAYSSCGMAGLGDIDSVRVVRRRCSPLARGVLA
jgi:hypothetical protein